MERKLPILEMVVILREEPSSCGCNGMNVGVELSEGMCFGCVDFDGWERVRNGGLLFLEASLWGLRQCWYVGVALPDD